ncbi:hypothetical protein D6D02_06584 [Aureobasidium pullulans]|uniref:Uncharacterized protein n=1 Tax=Aureobasidium pullulans TaxID=5580 RepID=A0A4S9K552_AURPU|nr:hypothetical protein D6D26_01165 [Aureobasidium pullulans]THW18679.1 hypothetical protein D6D24_03243 [Aureobasidium pullulans]THW28546.1 hypothetical protein D6D23_01883 [Aureobasidium pullulans]THY01653.1 hypothetical protein D6D03_05638 [Aureobasidium pullulans]THY10155.1 hypothetical protein D6D02_06584 [Aureobasidium pullulans]
MDNSSSQEGEQKLANLTWIMITDPSQSKDKEMMRNVRIQVMNDYLTKERRNPNSKDARVRHSGRRDRTPINATPEARKRPGLSTMRSHSPRARDSVIDLTLPSEEETYQEIEEESTEDAHMAILTRGVASKVQLAGIGAKLDVFSATPKFDGEQHIDVCMLKHNCTTYFGSQAMCKRWAPLLFAGRAAFLSTLCISSAYLDMMQMDFSHVTTSNTIESVRTLTVREHTVKLIGERLSDPVTCCNDGNIVSVLHFLYGEMIVACDQALHWHEEGLHTMVEYRGGLDQLGGDGVLAAMVTIEVFELSIFRETCPRQEYLDYARYISNSSKRGSAIPESPLYYPTGLHHTLGRTRRCDEETLDLINFTRDLTQVVLDLQNASSTGSSPLGRYGPHTARRIYTEQEIRALNQKKSNVTTQIVALEARGDPVYEATRLCARLYATAVHCNQPFSVTARNFPAQRGVSSIVIQIRNCLLRTDMSNCWDSMDTENSTGCARSAKRRGWGAGGLGQYPWWVLIKPGRQMSQWNVIVQQVIADLQRRNSLCTDLNFTNYELSQNATMHGDKHEFPVCSFLIMLIECMGVKQAIVEYVAHASIGVVRYGSSTQMGHTKKNVKKGVREEGG